MTTNSTYLLVSDYLYSYVNVITFWPFRIFAFSQGKMVKKDKSHVPFCRWVAEQSWKFRRILVFFEVYPPSCALKGNMTSGLDAYTQSDQKVQTRSEYCSGLLWDEMSRDRSVLRVCRFGHEAQWKPALAQSGNNREKLARSGQLHFSSWSQIFGRILVSVA